MRPRLYLCAVCVCVFVRVWALVHVYLPPIQWSDPEVSALFNVFNAFILSNSMTSTENIHKIVYRISHSDTSNS